MDKILTDVRYALGQLRSTSSRGITTNVDRIQRAIDALERVESTLASTASIDDEEAELTDDFSVPGSSI